MTKWERRPHWEFSTRYLGSDEAGDWLGLPAGSEMSRPGARYVAPVDQVVLIPAHAEDVRCGWVATFHAQGGPLHTYVDVTTAPRWEGGLVHAVDLDLDVIRGTTGRVWVDDEDEFARHRVEFGYPPAVVARAVETAERLQVALAGRAVPFDGTAEAWLAEIGDRSPR